MKKVLTILGILFFGALSSGVQAQFQGQITMNLYGEENGVREVNKLNMYITSDRIFLRGEEDVNLADAFNSKGMLIRNDKKDFVVLMEDNDALQVTKSEVEGLFKMLLSWGGGSSKGSSQKDNMNYEYTENTRTINGYETYELLISSSENDTKMSVWLTPNIDINWGMLAEPWKNLPADADKAVNRISRDAVFSGKNFPMLIEVTGKKGTEKVMEVDTISESSIAKAMVQIPAGVNLIGVTELMFKMMSGN
ncbi:MAG: DUF4412 domain-containing protein [Balneola sp.]